MPIPRLRRFRGVARLALIGYTALTVVLYFIEAPGMAIGYADKAIEVALVALLLADAYRERSEPSGEVSGAHTTGT